MHGFVYDKERVAYGFGYSATHQSPLDKKNSMGLFEHWKLETKPRLVPCSAFVMKRLCFRVPDCCISNEPIQKSKYTRIIAVKDRHSRWADMFLDGSLRAGI